MTPSNSDKSGAIQVPASPGQGAERLSVLGGRAGVRLGEDLEILWPRENGHPGGRRAEPSGPFPPGRLHTFTKRALDVLGATLGLVLAAPILLVLSVLVRLTSPGPAFFRHARIGQGGKVFHCYKLRTMVRDAEDRLALDPELREWHRRNGFKLPTRHDPRVTPLGRFLRRTHLDELPQLWNVLRGHMSLIGPRPIVDEELLHYGDRDREFLDIRPGIFGPWTAQGTNRVDYPQRTEVELSYRTRASLREDLRILLRHLPVLVKGQGDEDMVVHGSTNGAPPPSTTAASDSVRRATANRWISGASLLLGDLAVALGAVHAVIGVRTLLWGSIGVPWGFYGAVLFWVGLRATFGFYSAVGMPGPEELRRGTLATVVAGILHGAVLFAAEAATASRFVAFGTWLLLIPLSWMARGVVTTWLLRRGRYATPVVVIGGGEAGSRVVRELQGRPELGLRPIGVFDDDPARGAAFGNGVPFMGPVEGALNGRVAMSVRHAILTMPSVEPERLEELIGRLRARYRNVGVVPNLSGVSNLWVRTAPVGPYLALELRNNLLRHENLVLKRVFDLALGIPLFLLSLPLVLLAGLAVMIVDSGPMFFGQYREGQGGRRFRMWKIRTMSRDAESHLQDHLDRNPDARREWDERMKLAQDPRIIPYVGRFMRRFSVDELPQLWNVIRGDMSLVGPRPFPDYHMERFPEDFRRLRKEVVPGVSGYWQITTRSNGDLEKQMVADSYYIHNWSLWLDLWILHRTVGAVLSGKGAT
jgi:Undecaprenyl-phosphate galactose phosphotransferase WbaP